MIVIFYLKKTSALSNVRPPQKVVLTSQSSSMVNAVFLVSLIFIFVFVGLVIFQFKPSTNCGPFRGLSDSDNSKFEIIHSLCPTMLKYDNINIHDFVHCIIQTALKISELYLLFLQ